MAGYDKRFRFWFGNEISLLVVVCWLLNPITKPYRISKPKPMANFFLTGISDGHFCLTCHLCGLKPF